MKLIYAYIRKYRNIVNQEIYFDSNFKVKYDPEKLLPEAVRIRRVPAADDIIHRTSELSNVHIIVGKTGAGKTNILQLIGMPEEDRTMHPEQEASYFLLYTRGSGFVLEPYDIPTDQLIRRKWMSESDRELPEEVQEYSQITDAMHILRFSVNEEGKPIEIDYLFHSEELGEDRTFIFNGFERQAFPHCPYEEVRLTSVREGSDYWQPRINAEYRKTSLWSSCHILKKYIDSFGKDSIKRKTALVINCRNWADTVKQHIDERLRHSDYWTFWERKREDEIHRFLKKDEGEGERKPKRKPVEIRHQFVHDLWTDYALYLREWVAYIQSFPIEIPEDHLDASGKADVYQEYLDYAFEKEQGEKWEKRAAEYKKRTGKKLRRPVNEIDPSELPDFLGMSIIKRLEWLSMWIDRRGDRWAKSLLWQTFSDIKEIGKILNKFDNRYFTNETFTLPIVDMYTEKNRRLVEDLFERMEGYKPDDTGIFTKELLPYHFSCISSGEHQLARVLGGIEEYCVKLSTGEYGNHPNLIYLLDEPETYMHPEFCRMFLYRLDELLKERSGKNDIQVIISTHSPLLLSDMLPVQITRLDVDENGYCLIKNGTDKAYFGANIHTILADGFFLDYTIGEFARVYLQQKLDWLKKTVSDEEKADSADVKRVVEELRLLVPLIGDTIIRQGFEFWLKRFDECCEDKG